MGLPVFQSRRYISCHGPVNIHVRSSSSTGFDHIFLTEKILWGFNGLFNGLVSVRGTIIRDAVVQEDGRVFKWDGL